jgi:hypothetical protein
MRALPLLALLLATGCSFGVGVGVSTSVESSEYDGSPHPPPEAVAPYGDNCMWLGLVTQNERGSQQNALSKPLHTGDQLAVVLEVKSPRYVYILNLAPDGEVALLTDQPVAVDGGARFPASGWWTLAEPHGLEQIAIVATRTHIPLNKRGIRYIMSLVIATQKRTDLAKFQSAVPPGFSEKGFASMGIRAASLLIDRGSLKIDSPEDDVVVLVDIDHRPR